MNGTLRGLLDDSNIKSQSTSSPLILNDVHIPPLRDPAPSRNTQAPLTLELIDNNYPTEHDRMGLILGNSEDEVRAKSAQSGLVDHSSARETKKPHLAISELVDASIEGENGHLQLPSFVSLSVVERSPIQTQADLSNDYPHKRPRLETDADVSSHDLNRLLPRPIQKDDKQVRPLLPAMVTGLHEPPPSAALLPSMDLDSRPTIQRSSTSKMQVRDILSEAQKSSVNRPPEQMLNTPEIASADLPKMMGTETPTTDADTPSTTTSATPALQLPKKDIKVRRTRRRWTDAETTDLLAGVKKHGFGKWKQILIDPSYTFVDRTSIDLKDRFRVFVKDYPEYQAEAANSDDTQLDNVEPTIEAQSSRSLGGNTSLNKQRRKRHPWTKQEDAALLVGVQKYGFQWTDIHNDLELGLEHRRATDLRDRIRNLYPDGYKHAEARPLRAEVKKAEKAGKKETPAGTLYAPPSQMDSINFGPPTQACSTLPRGVTRRQTTSGKVPSIASLTEPHASDDTTSARPLPRRSKTVAEPFEHIGITLPSLALDSANDTGDWDNTLPPFINWDNEMGL